MKGIYNIGNSCYMNSGLQLLFASHSFRMLCKNNKFGKIINDYDNTNGSFNPKEIKTVLSQYTKIFNNRDQQDSYEFIIYMLDSVDKMNKSNNYDLYNLFGLHTTINIKCKMMNCLKESENVEKDLFLHLPITSDLSESYRKYKVIERLQNDTAYMCENCMRKTIARKKITTSKWPDNLIIVLKRFDNMMNKNNMNINIPLEWRHGYKLKGGIIHLGSYGGGHYIYYGLENNKWYLANDTNISNINDINELASKSYILYYTK